MIMKDWDTALFDGSYEMIEALGLENVFKNLYGKEYKEVDFDTDPYKSGMLINKCLNQMATRPDEIIFCGYNCDINKYEVHKIIVAPKNQEEAEKIIKILNDYLSED